MRVVKLDVPWYRSPFLRHSFLVRTDKQIENLRRAGVKMVDIDPARGLDSPGPNAAEKQPLSATPSPFGRSPAPTSHIRSLSTLTEELQCARAARKQLERSVRSTFSRIAETGIVDPDEAKRAALDISAVAQTLETHALFMAFSQGRETDPSLSQHALATCSFSLILGRATDLDLLVMQDLATGALLHDIGLLQVPKSILRRIQDTSITVPEQERHLYEAHPRAGAITLERQAQFAPAIEQILAEHHAYLDGSGFPSETRGGFTSDLTRIVMITDRYDELLTGFGGASPLTPHQALQRLYQESQDGKLDHRLVALFIKVMGIYPVYSVVEMNTKERAVVTVINSRKLHQPIITITHDSKGAPYIIPLVIDLANQDETAPVRSIRTILDTIPHAFARSH
jgi:HD-GYP domain-containing protein (c-di-GMP phosphodiesterase class II)